MNRSQITERGQEVLSELADSIDFWMREELLNRLGINDVTDLRDPWDPVKPTEVEDMLQGIGQDAYNAIVGLPEKEARGG